MRRQARSTKQEASGWKWLAACVALLALPAWGQEAPTTAEVDAAVRAMLGPPAQRWPLRDRNKGIGLTIWAQAEARPAMQYALLPKAEETEKGNAVVKYMIAMASLPVYKEEESDLINAGRADAPLAELNEKEKGFQAIINGGYGFSLRMLKEGARLDGVDWESSVRRQGYATILPSLGQFRTAANVLALEIRFDIKRHDWAAAREKLATGFALARHLGQGETLIGSLVGVAIGSMMCQTLEDWVAEPGAPNLYWPLSNLPAPFNDMRRAIDFERAGAYFTFPEMKEFKQGHYSADLWQSLLGRLEQFGGFSSSDPMLFAGENASPGMMQMSAAAMGTLMYPQAKDFLVKRGMSREVVEKMPVVEALERYFVVSWDEEADDLFKWTGLPLKAATEGWQQEEHNMAVRSAAGEANWFATMLLPSVGKARVLGARLDRQIAALRIVEAIRAYAAEKGALPENLGALKLLVPADPVREEAFVYEVQGGKAVVSSPSSEPRGGLRYELTLRK